MEAIGCLLLLLLSVGVYSQDILSLDSQCESAETYTYGGLDEFDEDQSIVRNKVHATNRLVFT